MLKQLVVYGISTGINRGTVLIYLPLLLTVLGTSDYGIYSLILVSSQLIIPIVSLNGSSAILREGSEEVGKGLYLLNKFSVVTVFLVLVLSIFIYFFLSNEILFYALVIAGLKSLHQMYLTHLRCNNQVWTYFNIVIVKVFGLLLIFLIISNSNITLGNLLQFQIGWYLIIFGYMFTNIVVWQFVQKKTLHNMSLLKVLPYALLLIPHGISQWVISSSDRYIINYLLGSYELGKYSIAYSLAMVLMLINSRLALALPTHFIKNYEIWALGNLRKYSIKIYSICTVLLFAALLIITLIDYKYFLFLNHHEQIGYTLTFAWIGLYFLGLYLFYANYFYFHKKGGALAKQTVIIALLNIVLTIFLTVNFGIDGAAFATMVSYAIYLGLIIISVDKIEKRVRNTIKKDLRLVPLVAFIIFLLGFIYMKIV